MGRPKGIPAHNKSTLSQFTEKAIAKHGNIYSYDKSIYKGASVKIIISCDIHGDFQQTPSSHLSGSGCSKCVGKNLTKEEFVTLSNRLHGHKYDYRDTKYKLKTKKIEIRCPAHGVFISLPSDHVGKNKTGCPACAMEGKIKKLSKDTPHFISEAKKIHGDKYLYHKVVYVKKKSKVFITCKTHGDFDQTPDSHLKGAGCRFCTADKGGIKSDTHSFVSKAIIIHGDDYYYSRVKYSLAREDVEIICKKHGAFHQSPNTHLQGAGCPICKGSRSEKKIAQILNDKNIKYIPQKSFENCKNISNLRFDFYIPSLNICIEYNGIQHYEPVEFFGGIDKLRKQVINDKIKKEYCNDNKIKLIIIKYNQDLLKILNREFSDGI